MPYTHCRALGCGRELTDPESARRGYGPHCWKARRPPPTVARIPPLPGRHQQIPGQAEISIDDRTTT